MNLTFLKIQKPKNCLTFLKNQKKVFGVSKNPKAKILYWYWAFLKTYKPKMYWYWAFLCIPTKNQKRNWYWAFLKTYKPKMYRYFAFLKKTLSQKIYKYRAFLKTKKTKSLLGIPKSPLAKKICLAVLKIQKPKNLYLAFLRTHRPKMYWALIKTPKAKKLNLGFLKA